MFFLLSILISISSFSSTSELAHSKKWLRLLHYKKTLNGYESQADGKEFFLSPSGKIDPVAEIEASIKLFSKKSNPTNEDAACKFPARLKWLNLALGTPWQINLSGCTTYLDFFSKLAARRASIVFSSYYLSNPNSAFGHTFLRLSRFDDRQETEMLDYGINYAAEARGVNPFAYAYNGLFGGFKGRFAAIPYYYKVREYADYEFRDLWSYELKLTLPQVLEMADHVWELGRTYFDYYYLQENCSYHLLTVLEAILPEENLTQGYSLYTIPADTIRLLKKKGLIGSGKRRESIYSKLMRHSETLPQISLISARQIATNPSLAKDVSADKSGADILDVAMEAFDYFNAEKMLKDDNEIKTLKSPLLEARAKNPIITSNDFYYVDSSDSPADGHSPSRISFSTGYAHRHGSNGTLEWRPAMHDLLDPAKGSLKDAQLEMFKMSAQVREKDYSRQSLILNEFSLLNMKNFPGQSFWASPISWEIDLGARQLKGRYCIDCPTSVVAGSVGNSVHVFNDRFLLALLMNGEFNLQNYFSHGFRVGLGPKILSRIQFSDRWVWGIQARYQFDSYESNEVFSHNSFLGSTEIRFHLNDRASLFLIYEGQHREQEWTREASIGVRLFM